MLSFGKCFVCKGWGLISLTVYGYFCYKANADQDGAASLIYKLLIAELMGNSQVLTDSWRKDLGVHFPDQ